MSLPGRIVAVVLAGGEARRMGGGDKPLLEVAGQPMLARIIDVLDPLPVAISANGDPGRFGRFARPVLPDGEFAGQGPLAGLLAGLDWAAETGADYLLTIPGDTPFIPRDLAARLAPAPACAASAGRAHPLVALWPVACRTALRHRLSGPGQRSVMSFASSIGMRTVGFSEGDPDPFLNINTPDDLAEIRTRIHARPEGAGERSRLEGAGERSRNEGAGERQ